MRGVSGAFSGLLSLCSAFPLDDGIGIGLLDDDGDDDDKSKNGSVLALVPDSFSVDHNPPKGLINEGTLIVGG